MLLAVVFLVVACIPLFLHSLPVCSPKPGTPANAPLGIGRGVFPGRVTWAYHPAACTWDGNPDTDFWDYLNQTGVDKMMTATILRLAGNEEAKDIRFAWDKLFRHFNTIHYGKNVGYTAGESVVVKVDAVYLKNGSNMVTPQYLTSLVRQLVYNAGVPQSNLALIETGSNFPTLYWDPPHGLGAEFPNITVIDNAGRMSFSTAAVPDPTSTLAFSNSSVNLWKSGQTLIPQSLHESKYVIVLNSFRGHNIAGLTASGKNFFGALWRTDQNCDFFLPLGHWCPASLHKWVNETGIVIPDSVFPGSGWMYAHGMSEYNPLVDLLGHEHLGGKTMLFLADGTYSGIDQMGSPPSRWEMDPFGKEGNNGWTCSGFASVDPIALDSVLFDFLREEPTQPWPKVGCVDNYMHEGAMANDPPSGTRYWPNGPPQPVVNGENDDLVLGSLGVHEHWDGTELKRYSRNLGKDVGIELVKVQMS